MTGLLQDSVCILRHEIHKSHSLNAVKLTQRHSVAARHTRFVSGERSAAFEDGFKRQVGVEVS